MPLPYAFQGRCMLPEIYTLDSSNTIISGNEEASEYQNKMKEISESKAYKEFVNEKLMAAELASSLLDNLYTGAIFMRLLWNLAHFYNTEKEISDSKFGLLTYGSGSKSKVFEGTIQPDWRTATASI